MGVESNIFNEPVDPKQARTFAVAPAADLGIHVGHGTFVATTAVTYLYFGTYANQRSLNASQDGRFDFPINRVSLHASFNATSTRERPSLEIDLRARRRLSTTGLGADLRLSPKTVVRIDAVTARTTFRDGAIGATALPSALNRTARSTSVSLRHARSVLTTVFLEGRWQRDLFAFAPDRNASSFFLMPGVEFSKFALISGSASVGYQRFTPESPAVPSYSGIDAHVNLASVIRGVFRVTAYLDRDLGYSFDVARPYYVQTQSRISVTRRLGMRWDVVAGIGTQRLVYRVRGPVGAAPSAPTDRQIDTGMGVGFHWNPQIVVGFDAQQNRRVSSIPGREYTNWRVGSSVRYGF